MRILTVLCAGVMLGCVAALPPRIPARPQAPQAEWARDSDALYPGNIPDGPDGEPLFEVVKVVDEASGRPIAGARVGVTYESHYPIPTEPFVPFRSSVSGADGWVRVRRDRVPGVGTWFYFQADGYAAVGEMEPRGRAQELSPGRDVWLEIRDRHDRVLPGAQVDWHLGCGHTPPTQVVHADAEGRVWLRNVALQSGEGWLSAPGVAGEYVDTGDWMAGEPPIVLRHAFSRPHAGRVLDEHGAPVAGAFVGCRNSHRGPWSKSDTDGRFQLIGLGHQDLFVARSRAVKDPECERVAAPAGFERVIRLPAPSDEDSYATPQRWGTLVAVAVLDAAGLPVDLSRLDGDGVGVGDGDGDGDGDGFVVQVIDVADGWSTTAAPGFGKPLPPVADDPEEEDHGAVFPPPGQDPKKDEPKGPPHAWFALPKGAYVVRLSDPEHRWARDEFRITVGDAAAGKEVHTVTRRENGRVRLTLEGVPATYSAQLLTAEGERSLREPGPIDPTTGRSEEPTPPLKSFHVPAGMASALRLEVEGHVTVTPLPAVAPGAEAAVTVRWPAPTVVRLRVVDHTGGPESATVEVRAGDGGRARVRRRVAGADEVTELRTWGHGVAVLKVFVGRERYYATVRRLITLPQEPGQVLDLGTIALPEPEGPRVWPSEDPAKTCTLLVTVRTSDGADPGSVGITLDGDTSWVKAVDNGARAVKARPGVHELVVAAPGCLARVHRLVLIGDETREVRVTLTRKR